MTPEGQCKALAFHVRRGARLCVPNHASSRPVAEMAAPHPDLTPVRVELRLDSVDSCGRAAAALRATTARPMVLAFGPEPIWYGFVLNDPSVDVIEPGTSVKCTISFINHDGATAALHCGASFLFGDGSSTRGVIRIANPDQHG